MNAYLIMASAIWSGFYTYQFVEGTWAMQPTVLTFLGIFIHGYCIWLNRDR
jgi:hypothetical protein